MTDVRLMTSEFSKDTVENGLEYRLLERIMMPPDLVERLRTGVVAQVDAPVLQAITGKNMLPLGPSCRGSFRVGYTFFEDNILAASDIQNAREHFDIIVAGSSWCEQVLRDNGLEMVTTVIQGIDPQVFNPAHADKQMFRDHFVVFSGGKFEFRKGQDIVIRAFKVLQDRHRDVLLVSSWYNQWPWSMQTMASSPHIEFSTSSTSSDFDLLITETLHANGIDLNRVIVLPPRPNSTMAKLIKNTDVGLFPNRCEGGTNLVLMEYMASGKPVIASHCTGHKDVIDESNARTIEKMGIVNVVRENGDLVAQWPDPDLDETIAQLEWSYQNRDELKKLGVKAGNDLAQRTWRNSAQDFLRIIDNATA